jgi:hypothetical protein
VVTEDHFQKKFLPDTAKKFSKRLLHVLDPFLKIEGKLEAKVQFGELLDSIFLKALMIKVYGMIGKDIFEVIWPAHNSVFESCSMVEESSESPRYNSNSGSQEAKKVLLVLVPGLHVYSHDRNLVDYDGFTRDDKEVLGNPDVVAHSVVVAQ